MPAFVIVDIDVHDPVGYEEYKRLAQATVSVYGGRYVARGGRTEVLEGGWTPKRLVILEFESLERAKQWWDSPEYRPARELRHATARSAMIVVDGVAAAIGDPGRG
jgi:uncharacterized protein (DUF1330 family)